MQPTLRTVVVAVAVGTLCALTAALAVVAIGGRPTVLLTSPSAASGGSALDAAVIATGDAIVSKRPDLALISVAVDSQASTAAGAQQSLATKAAKLIARVKALGIADKDINTSGYSIGPNYTPPNGTIDGYRAYEQLLLKWHNVDTVGKTLDALVQEGGATQIGVGFTLADPKAAQAEARSLAIADARTRAQAMATAAGVKLGKLVRVSDQTSPSYPSTGFAAIKDSAASSQVPVGQLDVQVSVQVEYAIDG
jgi:uncharacterized protein YggE